MYGICKICGCSNFNPCYHPEHGYCWWVDDTHELCSHCADKTISEDPETVHCVNGVFKGEYEQRRLEPDEFTSPCDHCEVEFCIGVEDCEAQYGVATYFVKRKMKDYVKPTISFKEADAVLFTASGPGANYVGSPNVDDGVGPGANDAIFGPLHEWSSWD